MKKQYVCDECGDSFDSESECLEHERMHEIGFGLAVDILRQFDFDTARCQSCPRPSYAGRTCDGCLDKVQKVLLKWIDERSGDK